MKTENHRIEFKRQLTDSLEKEAVAFLNTHEGGVIIIGMDDQGKGIGVDDADALQLKIKDRLKNNITPSTMGLFNVLCEQQQDKNLIKIILASGLESPITSINTACHPKAVLSASAAPASQ